MREGIHLGDVATVIITKGKCDLKQPNIDSFVDRVVKNNRGNNGAAAEFLKFS